MSEPREEITSEDEPSLADGEIVIQKSFSAEVKKNRTSRYITLPTYLYKHARDKNSRIEEGDLIRIVILKIENKGPGEETLEKQKKKGRNEKK